MPSEDAGSDFAHMLDEMEAVGYLHGLRCAAPSTFSAVTAAIPTYSRDAPGPRLALQPLREGVGGAVRQHVTGHLPLQVNERRRLVA
jgi:hypothetical protein